MTTNNLTIFGNSGSGKDTAADYFAEYYGFTKIHPLGGYRGFLEEYYGVEHEFFSSPQGKDMVIKPVDKKAWHDYWTFNYSQDIRQVMTDKYHDLFSGSTVLDLLINSYHVGQEFDLQITREYMNTATLDQSKRYVFVAIRNEHETHVIKNSQVLYLERQGCDGKSSDSSQFKLAVLTALSNNVPIEVMANNKTIHHLENQLFDFYQNVLF